MCDLLEREGLWYEGLELHKEQANAGEGRGRETCPPAHPADRWVPGPPQVSGLSTHRPAFIPCQSQCLQVWHHLSQV